MSFTAHLAACFLALSVLCLLAQPVAALDWRYRPGVDAPLLPEKYRLLPVKHHATPPEIPAWMQDRTPDAGFRIQSLNVGPSTEAVDDEEERTAVALANQSLNESLTASHSLPGGEILPGPLQVPLTLNFGIRYEF